MSSQVWKTGKGLVSWAVASSEEGLVQLFRAEKSVFTDIVELVKLTESPDAALLDKKECTVCAGTRVSLKFADYYFCSHKCFEEWLDGTVNVHTKSTVASNPYSIIVGSTGRSGET